MLKGARAQELAFAEGRGADPATINVATPTNSANVLGVEADDEEGDPLVVAANVDDDQGCRQRGIELASRGRPSLPREPTN